MAACKDTGFAVDKLAYLRAQGIWPNGKRYLWTDAFGVVLLVSLYAELKQAVYLDEARWLVAEVERVLGRPRGIRIGEAPERYGQYFHYLAMWLFALSVLGRHAPGYTLKGVNIARDIHDAFVVPDRGVWWKMREDLSGPDPDYGFGGLDAFSGYVSYRLLDEDALAPQIAAMHRLIMRSTPGLVVTQDLGIGMMLWMTQFFAEADRRFERPSAPVAMARNGHCVEAVGGRLGRSALPRQRLAAASPRAGGGHTRADR